MADQDKIVLLGMGKLSDRFIVSQLKYYKRQLKNVQDPEVMKFVLDFHDQYAAEAARRNLKE